MQKQLNHYEFKEIKKQHKNDIIFILENLEHMENIGSAFRLADGFNIDSIIIVNDNKINFDKVSKTARNCEHTVKYQIVSTCNEAINIVTSNGYTPICLEITNESKPLREINFVKLKKVALIVGNEKHGVSEKLLELVPKSIHIEMYGNNSSLNVITALSIATYHISECKLSNS